MKKRRKNVVGKWEIMDQAGIGYVASGANRQQGLSRGTIVESRPLLRLSGT